jgi:hypothetical protein
MSGRHSPPTADPVQVAETLKKPIAKKPKERKSEEPRYLTEAGPGPLTPSAARPGRDKLLEALSPQAATPQETPADISSVPPPSVSDNSKGSSDTGTQGTPDGGVIRVDGVEFHHASEAEFARLLTYYGIEWQYEPHQFPLQWHDGRPTEMFSPDFYLTEYDMYIELTTMRQSLVRRKNRKLRLLRALYPEINIKLLYRRDYQRLLERFGIRPEEQEAEQPPEDES